MKPFGLGTFYSLHPGFGKRKRTRPPNGAIASWVAIATGYEDRPI
jgi:hypothetical protein